MWNYFNCLDIKKKSIKKVFDIKIEGLRINCRYFINRSEINVRGVVEEEERVKDDFIFLGFG